MEEWIWRFLTISEENLLTYHLPLQQELWLAVYSTPDLIGVTYIHPSLTHSLAHWPVHNISDAPTKRYFFCKKITQKLNKRLFNPLIVLVTWPFPELFGVFWGNISKRMRKIAFQHFSGGVIPQSTLEACAFGSRIGVSLLLHETSLLFSELMRTRLTGCNRQWNVKQL